MMCESLGTIQFLKKARLCNMHLVFEQRSEAVHDSRVLAGASILDATLEHNRHAPRENLAREKKTSVLFFQKSIPGAKRDS